MKFNTSKNHPEAIKIIKRKLHDLPVTIEDAVAAVLHGDTSPDGNITEHELSRFRDSVPEIINAAGTSSLLKGVHLVTIYDPSRRLYYHTVAIDGEVQYSHNPAGELSWNELQPSADSLLRKLSSLGANVPLADGNARGRGAPGGTGTPKKKHTELHAWDPLAIQAILERARYLMGEAFSPENAAGEREATLEELEHTGLRAHAIERGCKVTTTTLEGFVRQNRSKIIRFRREFDDALLTEGSATALCSLFIGYINQEDPLKFCADRDRAREIYNWFTANNKTDFDASTIFPLARTILVTDIIPSLLEGDVAEKNSLLEKIKTETAWWAHCLLAAEYLENTPALHDHVVTAFDATLEEEGRHSDKTYEGIRRLAQAALLRNEYTLGEYKFVVRGLYILGKLTTERTPRLSAALAIETGSDDDEEFNPRSRTLKGISTMFIQPVSHLEQRLSTYRVAVLDTINQELANGKIPQDLALNGPKEYLSFGRDLIAARKLTITNPIITQLSDPTASLEESGGQYERILKMLIGVLKEEIVERVKAHYHGS